MTPIQQITYNLVKKLQEKRESEHRAPVCAPANEVLKSIYAQVNEVLDGFVKDGIMECHPNLNGILMFTIIKPIDQ